LFQKKEHDKITKEVIAYAGALEKAKDSTLRANQSKLKVTSLKSKLEETQANIAAIDVEKQQAEEKLKKNANEQRKIQVMKLFSRGMTATEIAEDPRITKSQNAAAIIAMAREIEAARKKD
jgi:predicted nuclease with TOPRIM domain